jgi:hypothetical protein
MRMEWGNLRGLLENGVEVLRGYQVPVVMT